MVPWPGLAAPRARRWMRRSSPLRAPARRYRVDSGVYAGMRAVRENTCGIAGSATCTESGARYGRPLCWPGASIIEHEFCPACQGARRGMMRSGSCRRADGPQAPSSASGWGARCSARAGTRTGRSGSAGFLEDLQGPSTARGPSLRSRGRDRPGWSPSSRLRAGQRKPSCWSTSRIPRCSSIQCVGALDGFEAHLGRRAICSNQALSVGAASREVGGHQGGSNLPGHAGRRERQPRVSQPRACRKSSRLSTVAARTVRLGSCSGSCSSSIFRWSSGLREPKRLSRTALRERRK